MTIEGLAKMINENVVKKMATKVDMDARFEQVNERFERVDNRLEKVEDRLVKIENGHVGRIEKLEDDVRVVKTKIGIR